MSCELIDEMRRLSKLSAEAVENIDSFDALKSYLHVRRNTEDDFRKLLSQVEQVDHKLLILLCGSAGDGKSHLLSYLKHSDPDQILESYDIINDATESNAPNETAIQTLAQKIRAFSDAYINDGKHEKIVLAINLGMLNNFIDSDIGNEFSCLREYVLANNVFSVNESQVAELSSYFQHLDFSDYQVYSLTKNGVESKYLKSLMEKIFAKTEENPFYQAYNLCDNCSHHTHCPVKNNYEFTSSKEVQDLLIQRIVEVCIKEKLVITSRDVLNIIYDIIVPSDWNTDMLWGTLEKPLSFLEQYISYTTPMLMFSNQGTSDLLDHIVENSLKDSYTEARDSEVLSYYAVEDISEFISSAIESSSYKAIIMHCNLPNVDNAKDDLKKYLYKFVLNYKLITDTALLTKDSIYQSFIKDLYNSIAGEKSELKDLYKTVKESIFSWDGTYGDDLICIDDSSDDYSIVEQLNIKYDVREIKKRDEISQFSPVIIVRFKDDSGKEPISFTIDYALYKLLCLMKEGYRPSAQDRNIHAEFVSGIRELIEFGTKNKRVFIVARGQDGNKRFVFDADDFGYSFKEA